MAFWFDKQTLTDIELFSKNEKTPSLFAYYNRTVTIGGQEKLYKVINSPFSDKEFLENRKAEIRFIFNLDYYKLKLNKRQLDFIEYYLNNRRVPLKNNFIDATRDSIANKLKSNNDYYIITEGIMHLSGLLKDLQKYLEYIEDLSPPKTLRLAFNSISDFLEDDTIS